MDLDNISSRDHHIEEEDATLQFHATREAYATVLHSSEDYVCGAVALAESIKHTNSTKDLILLADASISPASRAALELAGWSIRAIRRIRSPSAKKNAYNEWNYSKLRLWQLSDYDKIIFIDADFIVLRNLDMFFSSPQLAAAGNDGVLFNSGIMLLEPSECVFNMLMEKKGELFSYNGGDQGYLNEVFTWWHRLPARLNWMKIFLKPSDVRQPPSDAYTIHYLGLKPWTCYRDYDCNWDREERQIFASEEAHRLWWKVYDEMPEKLRAVCGMSKERDVALRKWREKGRRSGLRGSRWNKEIHDPRRYTIVS